MDRWLALSTDATWLRLPLLMLLASDAALRPPSLLSLSRKKGRDGGLVRTEMGLSHFISFLFYSRSPFSLSLSSYAPPPLTLCASVWSELETGQASEIEKRGSGQPT
jgi:hypothetical protein